MSFDTYSDSPILHFKKTKFSNKLSDIRDLRFVMTMPAQLNKRSTAALAGRGVFNLINNSLSVDLRQLN